LKISVAIDGPAGAGKSTVAKLLAKKFGFMYINTGAMYRAVTLAAMENNIASNDIEALCKLADSLEMHFEGDDIFLNGENISEKITTPEISNNVSKYAAISEVREKLVFLQRKMSEKYSVVMDGRDIGTVVLKDAQFKFYLVASAEERAKRRYDEFISKGIQVNYDKILEDIKRRDYLDSTREVSPLTKAEDAIEIDSTDMNIEQVVDTMVEYIK
jgi:cytidylate kinase